MKLKCNPCDHRESDIEVYFTNRCDNNCIYCIRNARNVNESNDKPNVKMMYDTLLSKINSTNNKLSILGGEPFLYLNELLEFVKLVKDNTNLNIFISSSVPNIAYKNKDTFYEILGIIDEFNISAQHYDNKIADILRGTTSNYDRMSFYEEIISKYTNKIQVSFNLVKGYFDSRMDIINGIRSFYNIGCRRFRIGELHMVDNLYVNFNSIYPEVKLGSAFSNGCRRLISNEFPKLFPEFIGADIELHRNCFIENSNIKATPSDLLKSIIKLFTPVNKYENTFTLYNDGKIRSLTC